MLIPMELNFYLHHHDYLVYEAILEGCPIEIQKQLYEFDRQCQQVFGKHVITNYQDLAHNEEKAP